MAQDIQRILALGVELHCGQAAGTDFTVDGLMEDGYKAVYLATGLQGGRPLPIPGNDAKGVFTAVDLLRDATLEKPIDMGKNVVVIGGGDVAFDAGRTALRLGAEKVTLTCIEDDETMPASADEIEEGLGESISFICSCMPTAIVPGPDGRPQQGRVHRLPAGRPGRARLAPAGAHRQHLQRAGLRHGDLRHRPGTGHRLPAGRLGRRGADATRSSPTRRR